MANKRGVLFLLVVVFTAVWVTPYTIRNIANAFLTVFICHLLLVVASVTSVSLRVVARMTGLALVIGIAVIHRECMVKCRPGEGVGIVAVRALTGEVIGGWGVAGGAVS